jgi:iron complex outermembrane receptor protein
MTTLHQKLMRCSSIAAMGAASLLGIFPATAQTSEGNASNIESVVVSGTRLSIGGYEAPTPVTVIGVEQIQREAKMNLIDSIVSLPAVGVSATPDNGRNSGDLSQGDAALSVVNLRNLGIARTLVLFDGQRVVSSNIFAGGVDLSTIPTALVQRIDVVTGGASAAYGSDAVAGVVNIVLDKSFTGLKGNLEYGDSTLVQHRQIKAALSAGGAFAGGRGHWILSGDHTWSEDPVWLGQAHWWSNATIVPNPQANSANGLPAFIHVRNVGQGQYTQGGLIRGNTAGGAGSSIAANSLAGIQFVNSGQAIPFNFGTVSSINPNVCYAGCTNSAQTTPAASGSMIAVPYHNSTLFAYASYDISNDIKASIQLNYGSFASHSTGGTRTSTVTISADNAFLPNSIASQFGVLSNGYNTTTGLGGTAAAPTQGITVGTINTNNYDLNSPLSYGKVCDTVGIPCLKLNRALTRGVFTLEGRFFDDWSWNLYAQHGEVREVQSAFNDSYGPNYNFAIDAVKVTPTNQGTSNLGIGNVVCRAVLLGNPAAAGCQPLNIMGNGVASNAAKRYVNPGLDPSSGLLNREVVKINQTVFSGTVQGELPWVLPAGKVAMAAGGEYRLEQAGQYQALLVNLTTPWAAGNFRNYTGAYNVQEGFVEAEIPILKDNIVEDLNFNAAGRLTSYSTSGLVETWKLGATSRVDDNIKLRATWSLDIRAPLISDLASPGVVAISQLQYPLGSPSYQAQTAQGGNPNLQPEKAVTLSFGAVLTPQFIPGLSVSVDWYTINIHGGIFSTDSQTIINRCLQGETSYCSLLLFDPAKNGGLKPYQVNQLATNAAAIRTTGIDVQANYSMDLFGGSLAWELAGNYTSALTQTAIGITYNQAGCLGSPVSYACSGLPKLRARLSATYTEGPWSGTVTARGYGEANLTNGVQNLPASITRASISATGKITQGVGEGNLLDTNTVNPVGYLDLALSYHWTENLSLYGAVDNLSNVPPPADGSIAVYDPLGRVIRTGVRFNY